MSKEPVFNIGPLLVLIFAIAFGVTLLLDIGLPRRSRPEASAHTN
jgi:hypothetical protein